MCTGQHLCLCRGAILYTTAGTRRSVVAFDGRAGELIWTHSYSGEHVAFALPNAPRNTSVGQHSDCVAERRALSALLL